MRNTGEITNQIKKLVFEQDNFEEGTEEYNSFQQRIEALKTTLVVVYNATHDNQVAYINDRGSITIK